MARATTTELNDRSEAQVNISPKMLARMYCWSRHPGLGKDVGCARLPGHMGPNHAAFTFSISELEEWPRGETCGQCEQPILDTDKTTHFKGHDIHMACSPL